MKVPIITDELKLAGGWHGQVLQQAFAENGIEAVFVNLQDCTIDLSHQQPVIHLPGFVQLPSMAFIRGIAAGSLQQVITRLNILHLLSMQGVTIYNDVKAIERTVDKAMTSYLLMRNQVPTPPTWVCESRHAAHEIIASEVAQHQCVVIKPLFGSQGKGVRLIDQHSKLPLPKEMFVDGVYYLQRFIDTGRKSHDFRVFVINQQVVAAMQRSGMGWLNNVAQGANCSQVEDQAMNALAIDAAKALNIDYCGVDIIRDKQGKLWVLEVNSIPAWQGLQSVAQVDIAAHLVNDLLNKAHDQ